MRTTTNDTDRELWTDNDEGFTDGWHLTVGSFPGHRETHDTIEAAVTYFADQVEKAFADLK